MWDTIQKLEYRKKANIPEAAEELQQRLSDRVLLPLPGIHGEKLFLTGISKLRKRSDDLTALYERQSLPWGVRDILLLDAYASATIEGARTTVAQVRRSFDNPKTKDDRMVINAITGSDYAYKYPITEKNIRRLWDKVVDGVCENPQHQGILYRDGMVYIGNSGRVIHIPASPEQLPELMQKWFSYRETTTEDALIASFAAHFYFVYIHPFCDGNGRTSPEQLPELMQKWFSYRETTTEDALIASFAAHFYFVYIHPFCDGNGRTARIVNASQLYHSGYRKMKRLPLSSAINAQLGGYYGSLRDSEICLSGPDGQWMDLSPFVSYMQDAFERCLIDTALSRNTLSEGETMILERMNKNGPGAEITVRKAAKILDRSTSATRTILMGLVEKGYFTLDTSHATYIFRLQQHIPE